MKKFDDGALSEMKVMRSNAGYYIGKEQYTEAFDMWEPYHRYSHEYYPTREMAQQALDTNAFSYRDLPSFSLNF